VTISICVEKSAILGDRPNIDNQQFRVNLCRQFTLLLPSLNHLGFTLKQFFNGPFKIGKICGAP
jgi:hypothetical protein